MSLQVTTRASDAYYTCLMMERRIPELEIEIMNNAFISASYAMNVVKGRWPEAEPIIFNHESAAYYYILNVIDGRSIEYETSQALSCNVKIDEYLTTLFKC